MTFIQKSLTSDKTAGIISFSLCTLPPSVPLNPVNDT